MQIGDIEEIVEVEPIDVPAPDAEPDHDPAPAPDLEPVEEPVP